MSKRAALLLANRFLEPSPVRVESSQRLRDLRRAEVRLMWLDELVAHQPTPETLPRAQLGQDLFVLWATSFMREGFFVEFGAGDGMNLSNTALLERSFNWTGILAEPARRWHEVLTRNRRCAIDTRCVWSDSNQRLNFAETGEAELSTLSRFVEIKDPHREKRRTAIEYEVDTVSLNDLLEEYSAPDSIDYLSVDTEGSEYEILSAFDFDRRQIRVITVEHNYDGDQRNRLHGLLVERGFVRVLEDTSAWDDWYVNRSMVPLAELRGSG